MFYSDTVTSLASNFSLLVCFVTKWIVEVEEKMVHRKKCLINIHTGKEEVQAWAQETWMYFFVSFHKVAAVAIALIMHHQSDCWSIFSHL